MGILYVEERKEVEIYGFGATGNLGSLGNPDSLQITVLEIQDIRETTLAIRVSEGISFYLYFYYMSD